MRLFINGVDCGTRVSDVKMLVEDPLPLTGAPQPYDKVELTLEITGDFTPLKEAIQRVFLKRALEGQA